MPAIDELFQKLRADNQKALMPFVTAGDPDVVFTSAVLEEIVGRGAHLCEVGIPYSDPIADGPVIQASYTRALGNKVKLADILGMLARATPKLAAPVVTMVSYAIIFRHGLAAYCDDAKQAGVDGLIVPDLPVEESPELAKICSARGLSLIQLVTPTHATRAGSKDLRNLERIRVLRLGKLVSPANEPNCRPTLSRT